MAEPLPTFDSFQADARASADYPRSPRDCNGEESDPLYPALALIGAVGRYADVLSSAIIGRFPQVEDGPDWARRPSDQVVDLLESATALGVLADYFRAWAAEGRQPSGAESSPGRAVLDLRGLAQDLENDLYSRPSLGHFCMAEAPAELRVSARRALGECMGHVARNCDALGTTLALVSMHSIEILAAGRGAEAAR